MLDKKLIMMSVEISVGMIYNTKTKVLAIGGNQRFKNIIESLIKLFSKNKPKFKQVQLNKIKYSVKCKQEPFDEGIKCLRNSGVSVVNVKTLGNIMR